MSAKPGSSPLARGTHTHAVAAYLYTRFIPAGAGNTAAFVSPRDTLTVHPRWRGEHGEHVAILLLDVGSSPLARGTRQLQVEGLELARFIPAGAGNTGSGSCR